MPVTLGAAQPQRGASLRISGLGFWDSQGDCFPDLSCWLKLVLEGYTYIYIYATLPPPPPSKIYVFLLFAGLLRHRQSGNDNPKHSPQLNRSLVCKGFL